MCTLVVLRRPDHDWPLLVAANRDEMRGRAWSGPDRHWPDRPEVIAGLDHVAQGTWFGVNDHGVVAAVMDRADSLGPAPDKRSRGELVLEALDHAEAAEAARALTDLEPLAYRPFNLFVADSVSAHWLRNDPSIAAVTENAIPEGLHMIAAGDLDDAGVPRIREYLSRFRSAPAPAPATGQWAEWQALLASRAYATEHGPLAAMNVDLGPAFGTVCSHLAAIPRFPSLENRPVFLFAGGPPDRFDFEPVAV